MVKITKIQPTTTVSPSSTASRMGVVTVGTPNISGITQPIADSLNAFGEAQAKLYDTKWLNNYEFNTGMFINNHVNDILASGEIPNLEKFNAEMNAYNDAILTEAPERLKIAANGYFQTKFINSFEVLRDQANTLTFNDAVETHSIWSNNIIADYENSLLQITMTAPDPITAMEKIHELSGSTLTNALEGYSERYSSLFPFSGGKFNELTLKESELNLLKNVEVARVNAIYRSFYQGIDITNSIEVEAADKAAALFQSNYLKNKDDARGLNYEIFTEYQEGEDTPISIGENTIESVIAETNTYLGQLRSSNTNKAVKEEIDKLSKDYEFVESIEKGLGNITDSSGEGALFTTSLGGTGEVQPYTFKQMKQYFINSGVEVTDAKIQTLTDKNIAKFNAISVFRLGTTLAANDTLFENPGKRVSILIDERLSDQDITLLGGKDNIMSGYYNYLLNGFGYENNVQFFENQDENNLTTITKLMQFEDYIPSGYSNWFATLDEQTIANANVEDLVSLISKRLPAYDVLTNGGAFQPDGMSNDLYDFYSKLSEYRREGMSNESIIQVMKKNLDRPESVNKEIETINQTYLTNTVVGNEESLFVNAMVEMSKAAYTNDGHRRKIYDHMGLRGYPIPNDEKSAERIFRKFYNENSGLIDRMIQESTMGYFNSISTTRDTEDQKAQRFNQAIRYSFNNLNKGNYGNTEFMDNVSGSSYMFMPIEKEHKNIAKVDIGNSFAAYAYNNISEVLSDINHPMYESLTDQFTTKDGKVQIPSIEKIKELIETGNIYLTYRDDGGSGTQATYDMVVANSGTAYIEPDNFDSLNSVSFDGSGFNPTEYTLNGNWTLDNLKQKFRMDFASDYGQAGVLDKAENILIAPIVVWAQDTFGDLDIEGNYAKLLQELHSNPSTKLYLSFQLDHKDKKFNSIEDRNTVFNIVDEGMSRILDIEKTKYSDDLLNKTYNFVDEEYNNFTPITKAFLSKVLLDNPNINKKEFRKAVITSDIEYFNNLYNSPELNPFFTLFFVPQLIEFNE